MYWKFLFSSFSFVITSIVYKYMQNYLILSSSIFVTDQETANCKIVKKYLPFLNFFYNFTKGFILKYSEGAYKLLPRQVIYHVYTFATPRPLWVLSIFKTPYAYSLTRSHLLRNTWWRLVTRGHRRRCLPVFTYLIDVVLIWEGQGVGNVWPGTLC